MIIKKFQGKTEEEAMTLAKKELGNSVVLMNVKQVKRKGLFSILKPQMIEVTVALEEEPVDQTADLRTAMAADLEISGGVPSGTLELIRQLEDAVEDNVEQKVEAKNSAPQAIQDIASGITMVGATLNLADKNPETGKTPTVTLELDEPKKGIVIDEQQHNAVQFSMKLNGAIDKDDKEQAGQQLIVPVTIDMPVPKGINPDFLVILHKIINHRN
jgi:flagellar biosynthesis GTPase FlhF